MNFWIAEARSFFDSLRLPFRLDAANDPFFGRAGRLMASSQLERNLKVELLIPVTSETEPTACCSFNYAENHFTDAWQIVMLDGGRAFSACVAFGMERTTLALFRHHGIDPRAGPTGFARYCSADPSHRRSDGFWRAPKVRIDWRSRGWIGGRHLTDRPFRCIAP